MTRKGLDTVGLDKLEATLDTYGADRTRWPAPLRHALSGLIAGNAEAQELLKKAEIFDRLLDKAPQYDAARAGRLADRIVAAAERQPRLMTTDRREATALAASLVLGVIAGQSKIFNELLVGDGARATGISQQLAQTDDADSFLDEDLL
jgi:hypothetical protein